jgi:hypothetical protein
VRGVAVLSTVLAALLGAFAVAGCGGDDNGDTGGEVTSSEVTVNLAEASLSGQTGTATLIAAGDQTDVSIEIDGKPVSDSQPAYIYEGNCGSVPGDLGEPVFNLPDVVGGASRATVDVSLETLTSGNYAINLHRSDEDLATYTSCGKIER